MDGELLKVESTDSLDLYIETHTHEQSKRSLRWLFLALIISGIAILYFIVILVYEILKSDSNDPVPTIASIVVFLIISYIIYLLRRNHNFIWIHQEGRDEFFLKFESVILYDQNNFDTIEMTIMGRKVVLKHKRSQNIFGEEMELYKCINFQKTVDLAQELEVIYNGSHKFQLPSREIFIQKELTPIRLVFVSNNSLSNFQNDREKPF